MYQGYKTFEDLKCWQLARKFRKDIYDISKDFPEFEKYVLISQIRRSAISITANIAEGFGRFTFQENINFCRISRGSVHETLDHLHTALDENYITKEEYVTLYKAGKDMERAINGYIGFLNKQKDNY